MTARVRVLLAVGDGQPTTIATAEIESAADPDTVPALLEQAAAEWRALNAVTTPTEEPTP